METPFTRRLTFALAFVGLALAAWQGFARAEEAGAAATERNSSRFDAVDEAVGAPGRDPYAFYVFNRHVPVSETPSARFAIATARPRPAPFASVARGGPRYAPSRSSAD